MLTSDAIAHFGSRIRLARALTDAGYPMTRNACTHWGERVPELVARRLHEITRGRLKFKPEEYRKEVAA